MTTHPPELRALCAHAAERFESLAGEQPLEQRGAIIAELGPLLVQIDQAVKALDLHDPAFPREQGWLVDASSALQTIAMDRGGDHVPRLARRAARDLRRIADA